MFRAAAGRAVIDFDVQGLSGVGVGVTVRGGAAGGAVEAGSARGRAGGGAQPAGGVADPLVGSPGAGRTPVVGPLQNPTYAG